eukprot:CAMPEP_0201479890 /NCGR_PEP_ID=MMETSP0151_2-20130828/4517_1 /ASSEMBLY_ACC=CAM_ASM_000257 /TAXON_ID=200890 /ORGANISM="Paramoeba atlantica, Strain 621/1 / CCAP 1560/9" /LENGTH=806 /DNA_ID=CAMNT_0047861593 /DNA_START=81 /DNA_END=2501 /DNA_ORIENTATION=+
MNKAPRPPLQCPPQVITRRTKHGHERRFVVGKMLGKGGFARCFQVTDRTDPSKVYAAKIVQKDWLSKKMEVKLVSEIKIHRALKHDGVVKLFTQFEDPEFVYIILELCTNQTLVELLRQRKRITEPELRFFGLQILLTVQHLHHSGVIHRDLKLGNLFLDSKMRIKLGDFGLATKLENHQERRKTICGTPNYIAPEIITKGGPGHTFPVDVWSIGCIFYTLLVGYPPFQSKSVNDTYAKIKESSYQWPNSSRVSKGAADLVRRMLLVNAEDRITVTEALSHSFFAEPIPVSLPVASRFQDPSLHLKLVSPHQVSFYGEPSRRPLGDISSTARSPNPQPMIVEKTENLENTKTEAIKDSKRFLRVPGHRPPVKRAPSSLSPQKPQHHQQQHHQQQHHQQQHHHQQQQRQHQQRQHQQRQLQQEVHSPPKTQKPHNTVHQHEQIREKREEVEVHHHDVECGDGPASETNDEIDCPLLPARFFCTLSKRLMQIPVMTSCGHWFNESEVKEYISKVHPRQPFLDQKTAPCPVCEAPLAINQLRSQPILTEEISQLLRFPHPNVFLLRSHSFTQDCLAHFETSPYSETPITNCNCISAFVKEFADYSTKYGLAYQLFDGRVGAYFNDRTKIALSPCRSYVHYVPYGSPQTKQKFLTFNKYAAEDTKKVKLLSHFVTHFDSVSNSENRPPLSNPLTTPARFVSDGPSLSEEMMVSNLESNSEQWSLPQLEKWHKSGNEYVFILSQGAIQISFDDGSAIMFYRCNQSFTFLSPWKTLQTFNFSSTLYRTQRDVTERLAAAERLLLQFGVITSD